jgi:hypothetical protein
LGVLINADVVQSNDLVDDFHVLMKVNNIVDGIRDSLICKERKIYFFVLVL